MDKRKNGAGQALFVLSLFIWTDFSTAADTLSAYRIHIAPILVNNIDSPYRAQARATASVRHVSCLPAAALHKRPARGRAFIPLAIRYFD